MSNVCEFVSIRSFVHPVTVFQSSDINANSLYVFNKHSRMHMHMANSRARAHNS